MCLDFLLGVLTLTKSYWQVCFKVPDKSDVVVVKYTSGKHWNAKGKMF